MPCHSNFEIYGQIFWCTHSTEASLADFFLRKGGGWFLTLATTDE